jgi:hypothetical protein
MHIASGFGESAVGSCGLASAEALIGESGKVQTAKITNIKMKNVGTAQPISCNNLQGFVCVSDE